MEATIVRRVGGSEVLEHSDIGVPAIATDELLGAIETGESPLTRREADVLTAAATGIPTDQIAELLHLSSFTVRNYLSNAITKIGGRNRIDAIRIARDAGWIESV
jgi:two-component system response regulator DesR